MAYCGLGLGVECVKHPEFKARDVILGFVTKAFQVTRTGFGF